MSTARLSEFEYLCLIARPRAALDRTRQALRAGLDFDALLRLAVQHSVWPPLLDILGQLGWETVPAEFRAECEHFRRGHLARSLLLSDELRRVDELFARHDIQLVAFKGATLAAALYGDLSLREYGDLDVIVRKHQVGEAERLLATLGYGGPFADAEFRHAFLAFQQQYAFVRQDIGVSIDLHWHFNGTHSPFPLQPHAVWDDLTQVTIGDRRIATLSAANLALLLAGHGTKEAWKKLGWVRDFATLIDRHPDLDWRDVLRRARAQRCGNSVLLGCALADILLGVPVPAALADALHGNRALQAKAKAMAETLRRAQPLPDVRPYLEDLGLCDRPIDRVRSVVQQAFTRTASDYAAWPLRPPFWGVYYLTRPFRLALRVYSAATARR